MDEAGDSDSTGPTLEQVLEVFRSKNAGVDEVTPELCQLAQMLTPQAQAQLSEQIALANAAAQASRTLWSALIVHVPKLKAALQEQIVAGPELAGSFSDYRRLWRLLTALKGAAETEFFQQAEFGDTTRWQAQCMHLFAAVERVLLRRSGHEPGFTVHGPACRVTAALFRRFLGRSATTPNAVSSLVRAQRRKYSGKTNQSGNEAKS